MPAAHHSTTHNAPHTVDMASDPNITAEKGVKKRDCKWQTRVWSAHKRSICSMTMVLSIRGNMQITAALSE